MSKVNYFAPLRERTFLIEILKRSRNSVLVPTSPGYLMRLPSIVMQVQLGYCFFGRNVPHNFGVCDFFSVVLWDIVIVDDVACVGGFIYWVFFPWLVPMPWYRQPSLFVYDVVYVGHKR